MEINKELLIQMLRLEPLNDKEIGYNNALISLLKKTVDVSETPNRKEILRQTFKDDLLFSRITEPYFTELWAAMDFNGSNKLSFVKLLKEATGLGLKEAKDITDSFYDNVKFIIK
jgi:ribosomal protein L7/L12